MTTGETPVLQAADAWELIHAIETDGIIGLRDQALIGVMLYFFARVSGGAIAFWLMQRLLYRAREWKHVGHQKGFGP